MNSIKKIMKLICKKIGVVMLAFCLMATGNVFLGAFGKNNKAVAEEGTGTEWEILADGKWATLQEKLFEGGYYKLGQDFTDNSPNTKKDPGITNHTQDDSATVDYKAVFNVDLYESGAYNTYPHFAGCGPLLIVEDTTIDLNGYKIDRNRGDNFHTYGMVFWVRNGATLTIKDSSEGNGAITGAKNNGSGNNNEPLVINQTKVNQYFDNELKSDKIIFDEYNPLISNKVTYTCKHITYGGAFYVEEGTLQLLGGTVHTNGDSYMNGKTGVGAGVYVSSHGKFIMGEGAKICDNTAYSNTKPGNTFYAEENADVKIADITKIQEKDKLGNSVQSVIEVSLTVKIEGNNDKFVYDGTEIRVSGYKISSNLGENMFKESWVSYLPGTTPKAMRTNVGTTEMGLSKNDFSVTPEAITGVDIKSVSVEVDDGYLTIAPRTVILTSASGEKPYDGTPLTKPSVTIDGGFVNGEVSDIKATGSVTTVAEGEVVNTITYTESASFKADNYIILKQEGKLKIDSCEAVLEWSDTGIPYDGKSHAPTAKVSNLADGDTCEVTVEGAQTKVGDNYIATATALSNPNYRLPADATTKFEIIGYTITFADEDGTELQSGIVEYGTKPSYKGETPSKAADELCSYEFLDWSPAIKEVTGNQTYKATYKSTQKKYTVEAGSLPEGVTLSFSGKETVEAGKGVTFTVVLGKGYDKGDDFAVAVNGTKLEPNADGSYTTQGIVKDSVISVSGVSKVEYSITKGEGTKYTLGSADGTVIFTFKRSVNDKTTFGRFTRAEMDGREIDPKNYNKSSGSLILELKKEYLETLSAGEHLIKVYFDDDADGAVAHLIIVAASVTPAPASDTSPTTGDTSAPILWIVLLAAALVGISEMVYLKSRQAAR